MTKHMVRSSRIDVSGFLTCLSLSIFVGVYCPVHAEPVTAARYPSHQDLSFYLDDQGDRVPLRTPADWEKRRTHIVAGLEEAMGPLPRPARPVPLDVEVVEEHRGDGYLRRKISYHTDNQNQRVRAWLLIPDRVGNEKVPAVLSLQQTTTNGKDSPVGLSDRPTLHYALELVKRGYITLSPDYPSFGEYPYDFEADKYASGSMKAIYDNVRAIDVLQSLPDSDGERIGAIGHSLGGHNSLFTAVFDRRIKAVVTSCGFTSFHKYMGGDLHGWSGPRYMPLVASRYNFSPDNMPFDFAEIIAAIAPRAVFVNAPLHDDNFDVSGVRDVVEAARPIYKLLGAPEQLEVIHPDAGHDFPDAEREKAYRFLDRVLKANN